ncbi:hypothetical protein GCG54_00011167 [Colletotrichum gloeosporioides]|uniref:Pre-mRNA splicing factor n=3 Tax=Colletotrichum gloeosporioides species complex TaxID=2707338 RepID=T0K3B5_COLGC|nr:uncharacterized protein CGCA056_v013406 [Colletotrichum aenigma]XP_045268134.1 uncharacterized protein GCG54_00011167 [Colletotrichum gloeosporioides]EQB49997.1 hypothetical protein CGLO_10609 [Colletotrichum gloeosporioides Cg-14]KAH9233999.1 hypothetical protein K456DRAFT_53519 [Colletotrichum gloeosporioides 23]KAF3808975.1 hypothetical protein GCG54_00011167 [Colletotrichum gloeosporioides]KAF5507408.1 hypothetical protein CGCA056_v013406 [Colletotrichum aenigma]
MTRVSVYSSALVAFVAATAMIVTSIILPHWVSYSVTATDGNEFSKHIGLHKICSNVGPGPACKVFPTDELCSKDGERYFCSMWRSVGFLASFSTIMHLASLVTFLVIMSGGKYKRETGWKILGGLLIFVAAIEFTLMGIVAYLFDNDEQFRVPGWGLDTSWILCTVSASVSVLCALGLGISAFVLPPEEGYEFLNDPLP